MAKRFVDRKTRAFKFVDENGKNQSYVLIYGDEVDTLAAAGSVPADHKRVSYRGRTGHWKEPELSTKRSLEMYFLDVGQGDAAFVVTPNNTKILVDGGLKRQALGFLIWKYRLDQPGNTVTIDHLFLSHGDKDHVEGLIPLLDHDSISVNNIHHNGIGLFNPGHFETSIGNRSADRKRLVTLHNTTADLNGLPLADSSSAVFADWIRAVRASNAIYRRRDASDGVLDVGDPDISLRITGPVLEQDGGSMRWFDSHSASTTTHSKTINGNSLTFQLTYNHVRTFFSGDLNEKGSKYLLEQPNADIALNSHVFKAPHHGSHDFSEDMFMAINPIITVVSSGEVPDHGHPRANFMAAVGRASRGSAPLLFSTEIAALFIDAGDPAAEDSADDDRTLDDLDFADAAATADAHKIFKKRLPGIINVRSDGQSLYAFRRVQASYDWESYGPINVAG